MQIRRLTSIAVISAFFSGTALVSAAGLSRVAPPQGIALSESDRAALARSAEELKGEIASLRKRLAERPELSRLVPDVEVYHKAVHWALVHDEFFRSNEVRIARGLLEQGLERARQLQAGSAPWTTATGLVVRAYVSKIDGSVQPYGLVVPASFAKESTRPHRLDVWLHGRDNHLTELKFISDRQKSSGEFVSTDAIVLHPYGRYCNAFKFAGEADVFEAINAVAGNYPVDSERRAIRGFSMGGAGCWHLATHHPGFWRASAPGAGFAETAQYTKALSKEPPPPDYEQTLWHLYDATDYAGNLFNCPTIAYSGELDKQKQAADAMSRAMRSEGLELLHLIGSGVEHRYEPGTKKELARRFDELMDAEREFPREIRFTTWTLRYNEMKWLRIDGLEQHWSRAQVNAEVQKDRFVITTRNVTGLSLRLSALGNRVSLPPGLVIDNQPLATSSLVSSNSDLRLHRTGSTWVVVAGELPSGLRKRHGLQGPIDDAFMDSFLVVRPTGRPWNEGVGRILAAELAQFTNEWRSQFRGDAPVKDDKDVSAEDIANNNLVLWGDPQSNRLLGRILKQLPVSWNEREVGWGDVHVPARNHLAVFIYPNPLNPQQYVVVNSGFTFRAFGNASNAQQTPKLPDFALVRVTGQPMRVHYSEPIQAGFFNEKWEVPTTQ